MLQIMRDMSDHENEYSKTEGFSASVTNSGSPMLTRGPSRPGLERGLFPKVSLKAHRSLGDYWRGLERGNEVGETRKGES